MLGEKQQDHVDLCMKVGTLLNRVLIFCTGRFLTTLLRNIDKV